MHHNSFHWKFCLGTKTE